VAFDPLARLWDVASGNLIGVFQGHTNALRTIRFSPDGRSLATADTAGTVKLSRATGVLYIWGIEFNHTSDQAVITGVYRRPLSGT
jgi:WD40 repeat protein